MPADMYSDAPEQPASPQPSASDGATDDGQTATLPKSILAGKEFKPGDEIVLRIDAIHDDQVMVSYAPEKGGEDEGGGEEPPTEQAAPGNMSSASSMYD